ncbi:hypothetical protein [Mycoplasmopsis bovirhinis]|uniref:hypothetical protein n=1 Tax=Mycoplasmopsis bovirhinis TaxID=29553 RepID=UPI001558D710|nr:hypothetical protein [Mycoplasmopsis bovirhinis]
MTYKNLKEFYLSKEEVEQALAVYNSDKSSEEQLFYIPYFEEWNNRKIYIPCEREYFYFLAKWAQERKTAKNQRRTLQSAIGKIRCQTLYRRLQALPV